MGRKNKMYCMLLIVSMISSSVIFAHAETSSKPISVFLDNKQLTFDVAPTIINGRLLVPFRVIFESLGAKVEWDSAKSSAVGIKYGKDETIEKIIELEIGNKTAWVDDKETELDVGAQLIDGRTMVPARFVAESMGAKVEWDDVKRTVTIQTKGFAETLESSLKNSGIIGKWASRSTENEVVDEELIRFNNDGTYSRVIMTYDPLLKGTLTENGKYKVENKKISLYDATLTWVPEKDNGAATEAYYNKPTEDTTLDFNINNDELEFNSHTYSKVEDE